MADKVRANRFREVRTGLYGDGAERVLRMTSSRCRKAGSRLDSKSFRMIELERAPDNEILLAAYDDDYCCPRKKTVFAYDSKDDAAVRKWLAGCVKGMAKVHLIPGVYDMHKAEIAKSDEWRRDNAREISDAYSALTATVAEFYAVYETLKGRAPKEKAYPEGAVRSVVGVPFDPVRTELEEYRRQELKKIDDWLSAETARLSKERSAEWDKMAAKYSKLEAEAEAEARTRIAQLEAEVKEALAAA